MSQQDGVSPSLASIEATPPPTYGTLITTTTSGEHPSTSPIPAHIDSSSRPKSPNSGQSSSATSSKVLIPKLSATTTELLARVAGNIKGTQQQAQRYDQNSGSWTSFPLNPDLNGSNTPVADTMRASSTLIELPTAPFVYSNNKVEPPAVAQKGTSVPPSSNGNSVKPPSLLNIAPKPTLAPPSSTTPVPSQPADTKIQLPPSQPQPPTPATTNPATIKTSSPSGTLTTKQSKAPSNTRQRRSTGTRKRRSKKRRRGHDSDDEVIRARDSSSDESDFTPTATQTKSGRHVNRPSLYMPTPASPAAIKENGNTLGGSDKLHEASRKRRRVFRKGKDANNITCVHCQRGHSPPSNAIVFCDECNRAWHQRCHDPPIENDVIAVKEKEWICLECKPVKISITHPTVVRSNPTLTSASLPPPVHTPPALPKIEVAGERFTADDQRRFLSGLSHATLVELLLAISDRNPTVPIFPEHLKTLPLSNFPFSHTIMTTTAATVLTPSPSVSTNTAPVTSTSNNSASTPSAETDKPSVEPASEPTGKKRHHYESSDDESEYDFQDHRLYPRAGNGIQLSTNPEDLDIMQEDPACPTFSYTLHKRAQA